ncbi:hypothetical protein ACVCAH_04560 [Micromonospora sp. LZ34]
MIFHHRPLARLGAAALLAAGALTTIGAPAYAANAGTDLSLDVAGTRVAAEANGKATFVKITNNGPAIPSSLLVRVDVTELDSTKAEAVPIAQHCEEVTRDSRRNWECVLTDGEIPKPGETLEVALILIKELVTVPYTAPVTFTIVSPDDTTPDNNSKTAQVEFTAESGVDLGVLVPDVTRTIPLDEYGTGEEEFPTLKPGDTTTLYGVVFSQGDRDAQGVRLTMRLPAGVTFATTLRYCEHSADNRTATCEIEDVPLAAGEDVLHVLVPITVAADVDAPVVLKPGSMTAVALRELPADVRAVKPSTVRLPQGMKLAPLGVTDVDDSDNTDDFAVIVAARTGGGGGGLPVTGPQVGLIGGIGLAVLVAGGVMFLVARRRRVVLVTPGDERPTA